MSKSKNEFTDGLTKLVATSVDLDHLLVFVPWLHKMAEPTVKKSRENLRKMGARADIFGPGTAGSVINIFRRGQYVTRAPTGKRITVGQDVGRMAVEVEGRMNGVIMCVLHEIWEAYIKNHYGKMLYRLRNEISMPSRAAFHDKNRKWREYRDTPNYFADYAEFACSSNCAEAFGVFRKELDWKLVHVKIWPQGNGTMEWLDVARLLAFCRNSIVHNEGRVSDARLIRLKKPLREYVKTLMHATILSADERIMPDGRSVGQLIEAIKSFAFGIYVLVSKRCGLSVEYDPFGQVSKSRRS